jgi:exopolyphosphatase/guanosine-5'-triphosphate,3'-diphosphate pyrophosphatase
MKSEINCQTYEEMVNHVAIKLPIFCERNDIKKYIENKLVQMLGTSGTVTTLGAVHLNLNRYDRSLIDGLKLSFQNIELTSKRLIEQDYKKRMKISCIGDDRAELIIPGCAILEAVCNRWAVGELYVADRGLREGMLLELMTEDGILAIGNPAATSLMKK